MVRSWHPEIDFLQIVEHNMTERSVFVAEMNFYVDHVYQEQQTRLCDKLPSGEEYRAIRKGRSGVSMTTALVE